MSLIPKSADSPPGDLRPITILSITYRIWARRHAASLNKWFAQWADEGLLGAMPHRSAAAASQRVVLAIDRARSGLSDPIFILTLDQSKCFDRISLETLEAIVNHLQAPQLRATLKVYKKLSRVIFLDGEPSPYVLKTAVKDGLVGIPQGCPLAPLFCNLLGHAWTQCIKQRLPNALKFSYLDDRLLIAHSWQELSDALEHTIKFDEAVGPVLNHKKCACTTVGRAGQVPVKRPAHVLPNIKQSKVIKYLGIDLLTDRSVHSQVASIRIADAMARLELIGRLPSAQRGNLVSDTQASLYCAGGVIYNKSQLLQVSRAAARALNGSKNPRMCIARSREATHLVGVGLTRTHGPAAIIVTFVKELWRLLAMQCISSNEWEAQYQRRRFCAAGLPRFIEGALRATGIRWSSAFSFSFANRAFRFLDPTLEFGAPDWETTASTLRRPAFQNKLHELRTFLRFVHAHGMATARAKDFADLTRGWNEARAIRETAYIAWHHPGGRSLLTGGTWSLAKQSTIFGNISALCPRCGLAAEDRHHRFWDCEANLCFQGPLFAALRKAGIAQPSSFIADLPVTTRRCGLFVHGFDVSPAAAHAIVEYLCEVNYHADCCAAASKRGAALPDPAPGEAWKRALALHRAR